MIFGRTTCLLVCVIAIGCSNKTPEERMHDRIRSEMESLGVEGSPMFEIVQKVRCGMSLNEVNEIFGFEGELSDLSDSPDYVPVKGMESMTWKDETAGFYTLSVMIKDGKVHSVFYFDGPNSYVDNEWKRTINMKTVEQKK